MTLLEEREVTRDSPVDRWDANMRALRTLKEIEAEGRTAAPEGRAGYSGMLTQPELAVA